MRTDSDGPARPGDGTGGGIAPHVAVVPTRERGGTAVEYALLIGLIALVIIAALALLGVNVSELYSSIATGY